MKNETNGIHASLFSKGFWETNGCFYDNKGKPTLAEGQTQIFYRSNYWFAKNFLKLSDSKTLQSVCQVEASGTDTASWTSRNSQLKECRGMLQVQGELILSTFSSEDGKVSGYEVLRRRSDSHYSNLGELFIQNQRHSSWSLEYRKLSGIESPQS